MSIRSIAIIFFLLVLYSCKTAEQIQRDKLIETMSVQMVQMQKLVADSTIKQQDLEDKMNALTGNVEENNHRKNIAKTNELNQIVTEIELLKEDTKNIQQNALQNRADLTEQKKLLERILSTLGNISGKNKSSKTNITEKSSPYSQGVMLYKKNKLQNAKKLFLEALQDKSLSSSQKATIFHNIGIIEYKEKKYDNAIVYFSKLFTQYPKSSLTPEGLLYLAKSFNSKNQKDEAKQAITELLKRYPKSKITQEAENYLKKI